MPIAQSVSRAADDSGSFGARPVQVLRSPLHGDSDKIDFSIVIPAHDRPAQLRHCLDAIATLKYPRDHYEVIVVDDGSAHDLAPAVLPFLACLRVTLLRQN